MSDTARCLDACGCCTQPRDPTGITNRPGLPAIRYRVGTYASFRQAMLEEIAFATVCADKQIWRPLPSWTARTADDYGIALLELWAYLCDILTFYQERIANESFLRTALLQESVLRLAALLGYRPAPGMAASVELAFTVEKDKELRLPVGLRVQSVPGQDEKPQKFETVATLQATSRLNRVPIYPAPTTHPPFSTSPAIVKPEVASRLSREVAPDDQFVVFSPTADTAGAVEQEVISVHTEGGYTFLTWGPGLPKWSDSSESPDASARAFRFGHKLRLFGYDVPPAYMQPPTTQSGSWEYKTHQPGEYSLSWPTTDTTTTLALDSKYEELKPGATLLLVVPSGTPGRALTQLLTVQAVEQAQRTFLPRVETVTWMAVKAEPPARQGAGFDLRGAVLYELLDPEIELWGFTYAEHIAAGATSVWVRAADLAETDLQKGRVLLLADASGAAQRVTIEEVQAQPEPLYLLQLTFSPKLETALRTKTAALYGNVAAATHGERVAAEVLGSGDPSVAFHSFRLAKSAVTYVPKAGAPHGAATTLQVRANEVEWREVPSLYAHGSDAQVYTTSVDSEGTTTVSFGDGVTGARLPAGRSNVVATYRQGLGRVGNVRAAALTTLLDRPVGLKGVTNPNAAQGGADAESLAEARTNAPTTVRTFGRIVSLRDFEDAARDFAGIAKARATWHWDGEAQVVQLVVAGDARSHVPRQSQTYRDLRADLDSRRDPNRGLLVEDFVDVPVQVKAVLLVGKGSCEESQAAAQQALLEALDFDHLDLGEPIHLSDVYRVLQQVKGVLGVDIDRLQFTRDADRVSHHATAAAVQGHLYLGPGEIALLAKADAIIEAREVSA